jgi:hypothetical protein
MYNSNGNIDVTGKEYLTDKDIPGLATTQAKISAVQ